MILKNFFIVNLFLYKIKFYALFFTACRITTIHLFSNNGNSSGECLVDLESEIDVKDALKKTNQFIGSRYIEGKI
jgi:hypothetical protein